MVLATVHSKAMVLLLFIHCFCCSHCLFGFSVRSLYCFELLWLFSSFEIKRAGCFTFVVNIILLLRSFTLPRGAMSSSVVYDCGIFVHDRLLFDQSLLDRTKIFS